METAEMGRVLTEVTIYNLKDLYKAEIGQLPAEQVRTVVIPDALVDTGSTTVSMPKSLLTRLGLPVRYQKRTMTAAGERVSNVYDTVRIQIMGREATVDPLELPDGCPVLIGQIPLKAMDWVIDMKNHKLIGNPAHGGEQMFERWTFLAAPATG